MHTNFKQKGFTLIELLVVVSIISLLSSVVLTSVSVAREKAAISKIIQQVRQVQTALEMYRTDNGDYPAVDENIDFLDSVTNAHLNNYIENPNYPFNQIKSFSMNPGNASFPLMYYKNPFLGGLEDSCEGYGDQPYIIAFQANKLGLPFLRQTRKDDGVYDVLTESNPAGIQNYCISTPL